MPRPADLGVLQLVTLAAVPGVPSLDVYIFVCVQVEKAWADVLQTLPPPLHRGRYGS